MDTQKTPNIETSNPATEMPATDPQRRNATAEDQTQQQQLGLLAQIVRKTLGLTLEEALQMAKDLDFKNSRHCRVSAK